MASSLSENDVLIILGLGFFLMWNANKKKNATVVQKQATYPGQVPINQVVPAAQAQATATVWNAIGNGLAQVLGTSANVASVGIANTALQIPTPSGGYSGGINDVSSATDGAVLNPSGNLSPQDYLDSLNY